MASQFKVLAAMNLQQNSSPRWTIMERFFFLGGGSSVSCKEKFGLVCWRGDEFC